MRNLAMHQPHRIPIQDPVEPQEGDNFPVEPDEGPIPAQIPDDPEYDRVLESQD